MARLGAQFARYRRLGIRFADSAFEPRFALAGAADGDALRVTLSQQSPFGTIRLTRDGSVPGPGSEPYAGPFDAAAGTLLRAAAFDGELALSEVVSLTGGRGSAPPAHGRRARALQRQPGAPPRGRRAGRADRAVFNVDIVDPCWIWRDVDLTRGTSLTAAVGQVPFNFQIGRDADAIRRGDARTAHGELEIRTGDCAGEPAARLPLAATTASDGVTEIGPVHIAPQAGRGNLCLRFARTRIDPIWTLAWVALGE